MPRSRKIKPLMESCKSSAWKSSAPPTIPQMIFAITRQSSNSDLNTRVFPAFRPDKALADRHPGISDPWINKLSQTANVDIRNLQCFLIALRKRHDEFPLSRLPPVRPRAGSLLRDPLL